MEMWCGCCVRGWVAGVVALVSSGDRGAARPGLRQQAKEEEWAKGAAMALDVEAR